MALFVPGLGNNFPDGDDDYELAGSEPPVDGAQHAGDAHQA